MEISYLGHSSFRLKGKQATLITDPYGSDKEIELGLKFPKSEADIVTVSHSHPDHNAVSQVGGNPLIIDGPGEYEVKGISVFGYSSSHETKDVSNPDMVNTIYLIEMDGLRICHLGDLGKKLDEGKLEEIDGVDILLVPVGGYYTLNSKEANELITAIEPSVVIPMHFKIPSMGPSFAKLQPIKDFLEDMAVGQIAPQPKLVIFRDKLPSERQTVVLEFKE